MPLVREHRRRAPGWTRGRGVRLADDLRILLLTIAEVTKLQARGAAPAEVEVSQHDMTMAALNIVIRLLVSNY